MTWQEKPTEATSLQSLQVETECTANHSLHVITCHVIDVYHVTLNHKKIRLNKSRNRLKLAILIVFYRASGIFKK
jgi:predicted metal-dependent peptidase